MKYDTLRTISCRAVCVALLVSLALPATVSLAQEAEAPAEAATEAAVEKASITAAEAKDHIEETRTVCGKVVDTKFLEQTPRQLTFLNFDQPHPNSPFVVVIQGNDRAKFSEPPEVFYRDKQVCVTGKIILFRDKAEIEVTDPSMIVVSEEPAAESVEGGEMEAGEPDTPAEKPEQRW